MNFEIIECKKCQYKNLIIDDNIQEVTCKRCGDNKWENVMFCLDRQKVKESINSRILVHDDGTCSYDELNLLLKELGLEE